MKPKDHKAAALNALFGNWAIAIITTLIYFAALVFAQSILTAIANPNSNTYVVLSLILTFLVLEPIAVGYANAFRYLVTQGDTNLIRSTFTLGFKPYSRIVLAIFLETIYVVFWLCIFIVPGIIMSIAYAMTPYILLDRPELSAAEAVRESRLMMRGHKWELFVLCLSFIGWILLSIITFGVGFLFLYPYMTSATASFYENLKAEHPVTE